MCVSSSHAYCNAGNAFYGKISFLAIRCELCQWQHRCVIFVYSLNLTQITQAHILIHAISLRFLLCLAGKGASVLILGVFAAIASLPGRGCWTHLPTSPMSTKLTCPSTANIHNPFSLLWTCDSQIVSRFNLKIFSLESHLDTSFAQFLLCSCIFKSSQRSSHLFYASVTSMYLGACVQALPREHRSWAHCKQCWI